MENPTKYKIIHKKIGETPLQVINRYRREHNITKIKIGYAGRLDPMATGKLLILFGEENKNKHFYEKLSKSYEFEILIGFSTDSYDLLGKITNYNLDKKLTTKTIQSEFNKLIGSVELQYPFYSSHRVNSKPLYYWARRNKIKLNQLPYKTSHIYNIKVKRLKYIYIKNLINYIHKTIPLIKGDFRQDEILNDWENLLAKIDNKIKLQIFTCSTKVSSGTYIRSIVNKMNQVLDMPMVTYSIKRTKIDLFI